MLEGARQASATLACQLQGCPAQASEGLGFIGFIGLIGFIGVYRVYRVYRAYRVYRGL